MFINVAFELVYLKAGSSNVDTKGTTAYTDGMPKRQAILPIIHIVDDEDDDNDLDIFL